MKKILLLLALSIPLALFAGTYSRQYKPVSKATIDSTAMKAELDAIGTVINGNITGADNIKDGTILTADLDDSVITSAKISYVSPAKIKTASTSATLLDVVGDRLIGCFIVYRTDTTFYVTAGAAFINGKMRFRTGAVTITPTVLDSGDWSDVYITADNATASTWSTLVLDSGATPGGTTPTSAQATNYKLVGAINWDSSLDLFKVINYRHDRVLGWDVSAGNGTVDTNTSVTVDFGQTFTHTPTVIANFLGITTTTPTGDIGNFVTAMDLAASICATTATTTQCIIVMVPENGGTMSSSNQYAFTWVAYGDY